MKNITDRICCYILVIQLLSFSNAFCEEKKHKTVNKYNFNLKELALPSEVKKVGKKGGSIFYSPSVKDKVLVPVHFWGEVGTSGLHFIPVDTSLVKGLSMAGGPKSSADLDHVTITRNVSGTLNVERYSLEDGGTSLAHTLKLQPGDTVFVNKSNFDNNRAYYTSLIGVVISLMSSILIYRQVQRID